MAEELPKKNRTEEPADAPASVQQLPASAKQIEKEEAVDQRGFWRSEGGQCHIFNDKITSRLSYEELIGDGSERLHGFFDEVEPAANEGCAWLAPLCILGEDETPWYGPSCGEKPEFVGSIRLRFVPAGQGKLGSEFIETQIHHEGGDDWQACVSWKRAPDED